MGRRLPDQRRGQRREEVSEMKKYRSYKDYLRLKQIKPAVIVHTAKKPGDVVIHWFREAEIVK